MFTKTDFNSCAPVDFFASSKTSTELDAMACEIWENFPWEDRTQNRREVFFSDRGMPYTYGKGDFARTYTPKTSPSLLKELTKSVEETLGCKFELCFINGYASEKEHLGWHADDSSSIDHERPIAVVSFGAERELWVKPIGGSFEEVARFMLPKGSLFVMKKGMQHTHVHRIPKHPSPCGFRVSLTFRGAK